MSRQKVLSGLYLNAQVVAGGRSVQEPDNRYQSGGASPRHQEGPFRRIDDGSGPILLFDRVKSYRHSAALLSGQAQNTEEETRQRYLASHRDRKDGGDDDSERLTWIHRTKKPGAPFTQC